METEEEEEQVEKEEVEEEEGHSDEQRKKMISGYLQIIIFCFKKYDIHNIK